MEELKKKSRYEFEKKEQTYSMHHDEQKFQDNNNLQSVLNSSNRSSSDQSMKYFSNDKPAILKQRKYGDNVQNINKQNVDNKDKYIPKDKRHITWKASSPTSVNAANSLLNLIDAGMISNPEFNHIVDENHNYALTSSSQNISIDKIDELHLIQSNPKNSPSII